MSCQICHSAAELFEDRQKEVVELGSVGEIRHRADNCTSCQQISDLFNDLANESNPNHCLWLFADSSFRESVELRVRTYGSSSEKLIQLARRDRYAIKVDSLWIKNSRLRKWVDLCDGHHAGSCHHLPSWMAIEAIPTILLIDVRKECLVELPGSTRYYALSYVWGTIPNMLETLTSNLDDLKRDGALAHSKAIHLGQTLRDAMSLVRNLGDRYIWIDRLCIVQDHPDKHAIIRRMDSVYSNAYCTIVVADGKTADSGLHGITPTASPRHYHQYAIDLPNCSVVTHMDLSQKQKYYDRGWTMQEQYLSPRCLILSDSMAYWACQVSFRKEDVHGEPDIQQRRSRLPFTMLFKRWPDLEAWKELCQRYNPKQFTFQEDVYVAFSGIQRAMEKSFPGGFLYGLPEFFFDFMLLWWPCESIKRRRIACGQHGHPLPSWSWLGWEGQIVAAPHDPWEDYVKLADPDDFNVGVSEDYRIYPLVKWMQVGEKQGQRREVRNHYHVWREKAWGASELPPGWTRIENKREKSFTLEHVPDMLFKYPLPSVDSLPPDDLQWMWPPFLHLQSKRAFFKTMTTTLPNADSMFLFIADDDDRPAGIIFSNSSHPNLRKSEPCELVAISRGTAKQNPECADMPGSTIDLYWDELRKHDGFYEFYNVLWIKWEGDHVVREGVGRIEKSVWEMQTLEEIDTQLH